MSTPYQRSLLRRTFAVMAAVAASGGVSDAMAAKVKLINGTGSECDYSSMSITPDGGVAVSCLTAGTPTPTPTPSPTPTPTPAPTPSPTPSGCPVAPEGMLSAVFAGMGNPLLQMQNSGQVVAISLPAVSFNSIKVAFGESAGGAYTPQPVTLEVSINKCPGYIDTDYGNFCNLRSTNGNYNSITSLTRAYSTVTSASIANIYGLCWAGDGGQYYVNARWTYQSCAFGAQVCGFAIQYNQGPW